MGMKIDDHRLQNLDLFVGQSHNTVFSQNLLGLGNEARINEPSTLGKNWTWRIKKECINDWLADLIATDTATYFRAK